MASHQLTTDSGSPVSRDTGVPHNEARTLLGHEGAVLAVRFNRQGTYCLSCGKDRALRLWNPHTGLMVKCYQGHGYEVRDVAVATDNRSFASCGGDKQIFLWDVPSGSFIRKLRGHEGTVNAVCYGANDDILVSGGYDQSIRVWDCKSRSIDPIQTMRAFQDSVTCVAVEGHEIWGGSVDGTVRRFDARMGQMYVDDVHHPVTSIALANESLCVLAACLDSTLRLLDKGSGQLLASFTGHVHSSVKMDAALTPGDDYVIGSSETGEVCVWDLVEGTMALRFKAHHGVLTSLALHPDGDMLLTSSVDGTIKVWTT